MGKSTNANRMVRFADYVNPAEAAEIIGCTKGLVYQLLRAGEFKGHTIPVGKRSVLIDRKKVQKVADSPAPTGRPRKNLAS